MISSAHARALTAVNPQKLAVAQNGGVPTTTTPAASSQPAPAWDHHQKSPTDVPPWPEHARYIVLNGTPINPQDYADDDTFRDLYKRFAHILAQGMAERDRGQTAHAAGDERTAARAYARASKWAKQADPLYAQMMKRVGELAIDPGRWIIHHDPIAAFVDAVSKGEPIAEVFKRMGDAVAANVKDVGPYVQTVCSFIPGFGTAIAAGIGAAVALAKGEDIGSGLIDTIGGALPGGVVTGMAFRAGVTAIKDACQGESWQQVAWDSAREAMPPGACRMAFDAATAIAGASLAQADPKAYNAIFVGAQQNGSTNATATAPQVPSKQAVAAHAAAAQNAYVNRRLPPAPPWKVHASTPLPPTAPKSVSTSAAVPAIALFGAVFAAARLVR